VGNPGPASLRFIAVSFGTDEYFSKEVEREKENIPTEGPMGADWKGIWLRVKYCL
jgi:hypothetical protein